MRGMNLSRMKRDVDNIVRYGRTITFVKQATKDSFGETLTESTLDVKAFPIHFSPFIRSVTNRVGWWDQVDIIFYISKLSIDNLGLDLNDLKKYIKVRIDSLLYDMYKVDLYGAADADHLYYIVGAKK